MAGQYSCTGTRRAHRRQPALPQGRAVLVVVLLLASWLALSAHGSPAAQAQEGTHRAALVVRFGDGRVQTQCVSFDTATISGAELLARSGLQAVVDYNSGLGGAVCSLDGYGCAYPSQDCFCRCQGVQCEYWAYYHWTEEAWHYSPVGASSYQVADGALEGWSWGPGNFTNGTEPPQIPFTDICHEAQPLPAGGSPPAVGAPPASYLPYLLFVAGLVSAGAWVLSRRGRQVPAS